MIEKENKEKVDKTKNKRKIRLAGVLLIFFSLLYVPSLFHWLYGNDISTDILRISLVEDIINVDGFIVRDEKVFLSPFDGKYIPNVYEGEKVAAKSEIAKVLKQSSIDLLEKIEELDAKIVNAQNEKNKNTSIFSDDVIKLENEMEEKVKLIIGESNKNSLVKVTQLEKEIDKLIKKKISIVGGMSSADMYIKDLKNSRDKLRRQIDANTVSATTDLPGTVSYFIDGYEEEITPESIESLTPEYLKNIQTKGILNLLKERDVKADIPFVKIIYGNKYNIVFSINEKDVEKYKVGDNVTLRINDIAKIVYGIIDSKSEAFDNEIIISVKVDRCLNDTTSMRKINVDLIRNSSEGYNVPLKSLIDVNMEDMTAKIAIVKANTTYIRDVKINLIYEESAIISNLDDQSKSGVSLYDTYVVNPKNIEEGQIIVQ